MPDTNNNITPKLGLDGAFIQFNLSTTLELTPDDWRAVLEKMRQVGIRTVILQRLHHDSYDFFLPRENDPTIPPAENDPTKVILDYADEKDMQVFIGLRSLEPEDIWNPTSFNNGTGWVEEEKQNCIDLIDMVAGRYAAHPSFFGWYLSHEIGNEFADIPGNRKGWFTDPEKLYGFYRSLQEHCVATLNKPVALSPYFNNSSGFMSAANFGSEYETFLDEVKINLIMLQDGIGERRKDAKRVFHYIYPFFNRFKALCKEKEVEFWGNVENFNLNGKNRTPTDIERFSVQIGSAAPFVRRLVTFDFFHYMNPLGHLYPQPIQEAQKKLYDDYKRVYVDRP